MNEHTEQSLSAEKPWPVTSTHRPTATEVDVRSLERELRRAVRGEVRFSEGDRALYATDGSNFRQPPIGVVIPACLDDVVTTVAICRRFGVPLLNRGGGTSLAGQCCNVAVLLDWSKNLNRVLEIDSARRLARVQPGVVLDRLRDAAEEYGLTFGPDPATHTHCTLGGMLGNNSCGVHSIMAGRTADNVEELEILTPDGFRMRVGRTGEDELERIIAAGGRKGETYRRLRDLRDRYAEQIRTRYPRIPRRVSGFNLDELLPENGFNVARALVGTESTCVTILEATVRLVPSPPSRALLVLGYPDVYEAADHVTEVMAAGPVGLEGLDRRLVGFERKKQMNERGIGDLPAGNGWLLVEFGGAEMSEAVRKAERLMRRLRRNGPSMRLFTEPEATEAIWAVRESGLGATAYVPGNPDTWPGWEDSAVPPEKLGAYLRDLRALFEKYGYEASVYGHFGQGCVHCRIPFELETAEGIDAYTSFLEEAADLVVSHGGSLSGEHGDGQQRAWLLPRMFGEDLVRAFGEFKAVWDPEGMMNPGKVVDAYGPTENLRLGADYNHPNPSTHFQYPDDEYTFRRAALRCVGVGKCRREGGGVMCPSYMVTREEKHSTRGRARLLFEMLEGDVVKGRWAEESVKDALDLCLACKGCKSDCPVNVDMATYKAEFLAHYYERRVRPRQAYAFGLIDRWARLASHIPHVANFVSGAPGLSRLFQYAGGVAPQRRIPRFAEQTFRDWFFSRRPVNADGPPVILWADTFNNYLHAETARAAVEVLEATGRRVIVLREPLCCGRPLYDFGMLDRAKRLLVEILGHLQPEIEAGVPVVGLEPSCTAVFRDELTNLFPNAEDARRLRKQTYTLAEFLLSLDDFEFPRLHRKAVVHGHCHHKSVLGFDADRQVLEQLGLECEVLDAGCCGMAGSFGFEAEKYDVSVAAGERVLLPKVRAAAKDAIIISDGFSCQSQIEEFTDRGALHLAQVLHMAFRYGEAGPSGYYPERRYTVELHDEPVGLRPAEQVLVGLTGAAALAGAALVFRRWHASLQEK